MMAQRMLADCDKMNILSINVILISEHAKFYVKNSVILFGKNSYRIYLVILNDYVQLKLGKELEILLRYCGCS